MDSLPLKRQQASTDQKLHAATSPKTLDEKRQRPQQQPPGSALALLSVHDGHHRSSSSALAASASPPTAGGSVFSTAVPSSSQPAYPRPPESSCFSPSQWRELELQALIYKYLVAGAAVPLDLVLPIRRSLLINNATPHYSHYQPYPHLQLAMMPAGYYWGGRSASDVEPGRCRRTDGKKWRCAREVVAGNKYCERHMHRGRSRSRKHVEAAAATPAAAGGSGDMMMMMKASSAFSPSLGPGEQQRRQSPPLFDAVGLPPLLGALPLTRRHPDDNIIKQSLLQQSYYRSFATEENGGSSRSGAQILRHFFSDWPNEQQQDPNSSDGSSVAPPASTVKLSIAIPEQPPKSDFSLKLSTGDDGKHNGFAERAPGDAAAEQLPDSRWSGWIGQAASSMGGPLAEALRLSSSAPSPTSVLRKPNVSVCETTSSVST